MIKFLTVVSLYFLSTVNAVDFLVENHSPNELWIGVQGTGGHPHLNNGGFILASNKSVTVSSPADWCGRFWPRTFCDKKTQHCQTGDCGNKLECNGVLGAPPTTLAEFCLKMIEGEDFYDISLVNGFNQPAKIEPMSDTMNCEPAVCTNDINKVCPTELQVKIQDGAVIGCKSACAAFDNDIYCCRGNHGDPDHCQHQDWPVDYAKIFKKQCPNAYSYVFDKEITLLACRSQKYRVIFGA